ncbi:MAG: 1-deoxy-D-xylulose-5-phosphate synthase N-terminal domain-containing protein [Candidatus Bathyarchaeia archaeon]|jgi:transketolase
MDVEVVPAILVKSRQELLAHIEKVKPSVKTVHIDIMDNVFVPNDTIGLESLSDLPQGVSYEFHWMVKDPENWVSKISGKHTHFVHVEAVTDWNEIEKTRSSGGKIGLAINPPTPVETLYPYLNDKAVKQVLVMTVNPGFSGQKYITEVEAKVRALRAKYPNLEIEVDGGINSATSESASEAGANILAASSAIFAAESIPDAVQNIYESGVRGQSKSQTCWSQEMTANIEVPKLVTEPPKQTLLEVCPTVEVGATKVTDIQELYLLSNNIRQSIVKMLHAAKSGHPAGSMGLADVFTALYFNVLNHDPKNPNWEGRDRCILSNGHVCPGLYATLGEAGYFPKEELMTLRKLGSRLQGHPHRETLPGIENSSGPLGQGLSIAVGMALVAKREKKKWRVYCVCSDGEHNEGQIWEAALLAAKFKLGNLVAIMDRNNIQIDGFTEDVLPLESLEEKYRAFGWHVINIDGHNIQQIISACNEAKTVIDKPTMIIAHTVPGKDISFMEFITEWHGKSPGDKEAIEALEDLEEERKFYRNGEKE